MKRSVTIILTMVIALMLVFSVSASNSSDNIVIIDGTNVEFSETSSFTIEQQEVIAQVIVSGTDDTSATTYNLLCTLLGHKTTTESIGVIEHCVSDTAPRCLRTIQEITVCTRCETLIDTNIISKVYIFCCD